MQFVNFSFKISRRIFFCISTTRSQGNNWEIKTEHKKEGHKRKRTKTRLLSFNNRWSSIAQFFLPPVWSSTQSNFFNHVQDTDDCQCENICKKYQVKQKNEFFYDLKTSWIFWNANFSSLPFILLVSVWQFFNILTTVVAVKGLLIIE